MKIKTLTTTLLLFTSICGTLFTLHSCKQDDEKYTVKGYLLQSCDNPTPVAGVLLRLTYPCKTCYTQTDFGSFTTKSDGSFEFIYTSSKRADELIISGTQSNGLGTLNYVYGIPANTNINVGNVFTSNNFYSLAKLNVQKVTSVADTIFYNKVADKFTKFTVGPFSQNQVIDTIIYRNTQFYDKSNYRKYDNHSADIFYYTLGEKGELLLSGGLTSGPPFEECKKYNEFVIDIK